MSAFIRVTVFALSIEDAERVLAWADTQDMAASYDTEDE